MKKNWFSMIAMLSAALPLWAAPIVYEGTSGVGEGKHIVFIASDHEYRSEETLPAMARILAKYHGFKCTVVFGVDDKGLIKPGANNVPGIEALKTADLIVIFTRFQNWPEDQMQHFVDYLDRAGPVVGLRTATHGFNKIQGKFEKYKTVSLAKIILKALVAKCWAKSGLGTMAAITARVRAWISFQRKRIMPFCAE